MQLHWICDRCVFHEQRYDCDIQWWQRLRIRRGGNAVDSRLSASTFDKSSCTTRSPTDDDACANAAEGDIAVLQQMLYKLLLVLQGEFERGMIGIPTKCMMTMHHIGDIIVMP